MIPSAGCNPEINIIVIGAKIISRLSKEEPDINHLLKILPKKIGVSLDHIMLSMDWLYCIGAISIKDDKVYISEVN